MYRVMQESGAPLRSEDTNLICIAITHMKGMGRMSHAALILLKLITAPINVNSTASSSELNPFSNGNPLVALHLYFTNVTQFFWDA